MLEFIGVIVAALIVYEVIREAVRSGVKAALRDHQKWLQQQNRE